MLGKTLLMMYPDNVLRVMNFRLFCCGMSFASEASNSVGYLGYLLIGCGLSFRYHMLGMFLLIQLSIVGGDWLRRSVLPALAMSMRSRISDPSAASSGKTTGAKLRWFAALVFLSCHIQFSTDVAKLKGAFD